jgi:hypothetical protein
MGTFQDIRIAIESRFDTNWSATDISWDNVPYTPEANTAFVRLMINEVDTFQASIATVPCHRTIGIIHILIMVPVGTGTQIARGYADDVAGIFRNANFDDIQCRSPRIVRVGDIGEHYQISCLINFWHDAILANAS